MELLLLGIIGGFLGGLLGIGGGTIYIPGLVILFQVSQVTAQGISLAVMVPMALLGGWHYFIKKSIDTSVVLPIIIASIIGTLIGSLLANTLPVELVKIIFGVVIFVLGVRMVLDS